MPYATDRKRSRGWSAEEEAGEIGDRNVEIAMRRDA